MTAKLATLTDSCSTKNTTIWAYGTGCTQSANQMHVAAGNTSGSPNYDSNVSNSAYDLTGSYLYFKVTPATGGTGAVTNLTLRSTSGGNGTDLTMEVAGGNLLCMNRVNYGDGNATSVAYNPVAHAWWQISEHNGTVSFQVSPDGQNWTTLRQIPTPSWATSVWPAPSANNNTGTSTDSLWADFNVNASNPKVATLSDPFTAFDSVLWTEQSSSNIAFAGAVEITAATSGYPNITAVRKYDLTASAIFAKLVPPTGGSGVTTELVLQSGTGGTDLRWTYNESAGTIVASSNVGYGDSGAVTLTYSPTNHVYFKISESAGTITWWTSPDGVNWTSQRTLATVSYATAVTPCFSAESTTTASTTPAMWSSLNTAANVVSVANPGPQVFAQLFIDISATDSAVGQTLTYSATGLPAGLVIDSRTGVITGDPHVPGTYSVTVTATDTTGASGSTTFTITVLSSNPPPPLNSVTVVNPGQQSSPVSVAAALHITATDSAAGQTLTYTASGLPAGMAINAATGQITGTPSSTGTSSVTVTATDTTGASGTTTFAWTITPTGPTNTVTVTNPGNFQLEVELAFSFTVAASDSATGQTLTYAATGLPPGMAINSSTGVVSGTPTTLGTYSPVTVTVTDTTSASGSTSFSITVSNPPPPPANTVTVANPGAHASQTGTPVNLQVTATDSAKGQVLSWTANGLPPGLSINPGTGLISGTPTTAGTFNPVTVVATDTTGAAGSASFSWLVTVPSSGGGTNPPPSGTNVTVDFRTVANGGGTHVAVDALGVGITLSGYAGSGSANVLKSAAWLQLLKNLAPGSCRIPMAWFGGNPGGAPGGSPQPGTANAYVSAITSMGAVPVVIYAGDSSDNGGLSGTNGGSFVNWFNSTGGGGHAVGPVKYWFIGNEPDNNNNDPGYVSNLPGIISGMHGADSTTVLGGPNAASFNTGLLSSAAGVSGIGSIEYHAYDAGDGSGGFPQTSQYKSNITTIKGYGGTATMWGCSEFNWNFASAGPQNWENTVWMAAVIAETLNAGGHPIMYSDSNGQLGLINDGTGGNQPGSFLTPLPAYWAVGIFTGMNGQFFRYSSTIVPASSTFSDNSITLTAFDNGKIVISNKDNTAHALTIGMGGKVSGTYAIHATQQANPTGPIQQVVAEAAYSGSVINYTIPAGTAVSVDVS